MKAKNIVFALESFVMAILGGIGLILYPQRGFQLTLVVEFLFCTGVCLFLLLFLEEIRSKYDSLYQKTTRYQRILLVFLYGSTVCICFAAAIYSLSLWSGMNISIHTLFLLSLLLTGLHISLTALIHHLQNLKDDTEDYEDVKESSLIQSTNDAHKGSFIQTLLEANGLPYRKEDVHE